MKIDCSDCKYHSNLRLFTGWKCIIPKERLNLFSREYNVYYPTNKNQDGDCKDFKASLSSRILKQIGRAIG